MPTFTREHVVKPWAGTTADVAKLAREAHRLVGEGVSGGVRFSATIERPGRRDSYEAPDEVAAQGLAADLETVHFIALHAVPKDYAEKQAEVDVYFFRRGSGGAVAKVEGSSEVSVNGIATALENLLNHGRRRTGWVRRVVLPVYAVAAGTVGIGSVLAWTSEDGDPEQTASLVLTIVGVCFLALAGLALYARVLIPPVDLIHEGDENQLSRFLRRLGRAALWVLGVVLVAAIGVGVQQLLT